MQNLKFMIFQFFIFRNFSTRSNGKRKSGFLIPALKSSTNNTENYLSIPYYHVISENKDFTLSPRLYSSDKILLQSEYRQVNSNSESIADFSVYKEKMKIRKAIYFMI